MDENSEPLSMFYLRERIPPQFADATMDTFEIPTPELEAAWRASVAWLDATPGNLAQSHKGPFLTGPIGTGKTHLAWAIAKDCASRGINVGVVSVARHFAWVRGKIGAGERVEPAGRLVRDYCGRPWDLLFLDDIGVEKPTDWLLEQVYMLVDEAYLQNVPLMVTSNLDYDELGDRLGERTVSRIVALTTKIAVAGADWRLRA